VHVFSTTRVSVVAVFVLTLIGPYFMVGACYSVEDNTTEGRFNPCNDMVSIDKLVTPAGITT
jgi:uncharacterized membrane protein